MVRDRTPDMTDEQYTQILLNVIKQIRSQKQRPSLQRIQNMVRSHHQITGDVLDKQLEIAVSVGDIVKIHNKGDYSYRDPHRVRAVRSGRTPMVDKKSTVLKEPRATVHNGTQPKSAETTVHCSPSLSRKTTVDNDTNLLKLLIKSVRQMSATASCTQKSIGKFIAHGYRVELDDDEFSHQLCVAIDMALQKKLLVKVGHNYRLPAKAAAGSTPTYVKKLSAFKDMAVPDEKGKVSDVVILNQHTYGSVCK